MILDFTFLVDLERESKRAEKGAAVAFLREHEDVSFAITGIFPRRGVEAFGY